MQKFSVYHPILATMGLLFFLGTGLAQESPGHPILAATFQKNKVLVLGADGKVEWELDVPASFDVWALPNKNFLVTSRSKGIMEVTRDKKVVFTFKPDGETYTCQPLPEGRILVGDNRNARLVEIDAKGKIEKEIKIQTKASEHGMIRTARKLANGNYLVCQRQDNVVREYKPDGSMVWEFKTGGPMTALRVGKDHTLISNAAGDVLEVDPQGKIHWQIGKKDLPGKPGGVAYGLQRLPNGNTVVAYPGLIVEFTPEKKAVWHRDDPALAGLMCFQLLDVPGDATQGEILR